MAKQKTPNPFNNNPSGHSFHAWQLGYDSDPEKEEKNPYDLLAQDLFEFWEKGRESKNKDIEDIPSGLYCYKYTGNKKLFQGAEIPETKRCPYWHNDGEVGACSFLGIKDGEIDPKTGCEASLLFDSCKECGIKMDDEE